MAMHALSSSRAGLFTSLQALLPTLPRMSTAITIPTAIHLNIPSFLPELWESILRAVPKKKQSHSRKRMRQLAGKALQDNKALNRCPACGGVKRKNVLCENCVESIKAMWRKEGEVKDVGTEITTGTP
ncbi:uncharacterized protein H6S33_009587 [Morchella sextelata]|uniref:uncharacterized protein n=1 Tax=Morchella sextelata TaxID=1174677 RepID=UPI001D03FB5D|nr:uncharacterized protein H6S33_009587 [Morchella sextelata]KAH0613207.1 hypothetical protein H6S33_009587 [Morchella sextelata]